MTTNENIEPSAAASKPLSPWVRRVVSALLLVHLAAVIIPPLAVQPSSMVAGWCWQAMRPYIEAAYLDHGYRFFAPEPGPSHLVRYELAMPDGQQVEGVIPNLNDEWPRLYYHRHFMLSEFVNSLGEYRPDTANAYAQSYARHLVKKHNAVGVKLYLRRHLIPEPQQVIRGMKLTDPSLYQERLLVELPAQSAAELIPINQ